MKLRGGYNVLLHGRPAGRVHLLPEPESLYLPLYSRRFTFSDICVQEGRRVRPGQVLARDPNAYSVPLLAPRAGTVRLEAEPNHIVLEEIEKESEERYHPDEAMPHVPKAMGSVGMKRYKLLTLGAWQFLEDAYSGAVPDPFGTPQSVIVSTLHLEPFVARGDVQLHKRLSSFTRGLEHLQALLEYQPIYLILPDIQSEFAAEVRRTLRGYAFVKMIQVPLRYPYDHFSVLARSLGMERNPDAPVWALRTAGVLAIDRALTMSLPSTVRIISIGGPAAASAQHLKAMPGYPLSAILKTYIGERRSRVIDGGALTGEPVPDSQLGLDVECQGLTCLPEHEDREFLGFMRPGFDRRSYARCFASTLRGAFHERMDVALRGERRPCVACNFCEEVCPAGIMPHLIHKYLFQDALDEVERTRVDLCVQCGLCSFVCPSKIDLARQFKEATERIQQELHVEEAPA